MKPRCQGHHDGGAHTSFQCVLDEGHPGFCRPYCAPDVDEWRSLQFLLTSAEEDARFYAGRTARIEEACRADVARLQAENDALRAIIESGCEQCAAHKGLDAVNRARAIDDAWGNYCRELDAEVATEVQTGRDDLRGLAGKVET